MSNLESKKARAKLTPAGKPYESPLHRGLTLGYRRNLTGAGQWVAIMANGKGGRITETFGTADDNGAEPDGTTVLDYRAAADKARSIAARRAAPGSTTGPAKTLAELLDAYALELTANGRSKANAQMPRGHLTAELLATPADQVTEAALKAWRTELRRNGMKPATENRILKPLAAAFNLAADRRVKANAVEWKGGLKALRGVTTARDTVIKDEEVKAIVAAAMAEDPAFGLFVQVHAETGARTSQLLNLLVGDLEDGKRLHIPSSRKGGVGRKPSREPVPITPALAAALEKATAGRARGAPLLTDSSGQPWSDQRRTFKRVAKAAGVNLPERTGIYALRHSAIARMLRHLPVAIVAKVHDTSTAIIEAHYGRHIARHSEDRIRDTLLDTTPGANVVRLAVDKSA